MAWNGSENRGAQQAPMKTVKAPPSKWRGLAALALVVVAGGFAAWLVMRPAANDDSSDEAARPSRIAEVMPQVVTNVVAEVVPQEEDVGAKAVRERVEKLKRMTPEERMEFLFEEAKNTPINFNVSSNRTFATGTEQIMSWIFTKQLGDPPPPLPRISIRDEAHLAEILMAKNPVLDTDTERQKDAKQTVELAKKAAIEFIKEGGDIREFFTYYRDQLDQAHREYSEAQKSVIEMYRTEGGDEELCRAYLDKVNEALEAKGIKKIALPEQVLERLPRHK